MCHIQEWQLSLSYFLSYFPLIISDVILCPLHNLNTLWHIIMILHSYVEQVVPLTRMTTLIFILSYFPLTVKATMPCILNTVINIFMRLYGFVEEIVTMCLLHKIWRLLCSYLPIPAPPPIHQKNPGFGFFVKIHLLKIRFVGLVLPKLVTHDKFQL